MAEVKRPQRGLFHFLNDFQIWDGSATLSFYLLLSVFPAIVAFISLSTFLPYEKLTTELPLWVVSYFPPELRFVFVKVLNEVSTSSRTGLISIGFLVAIWTAIGGVSAIIRQLNFAYDEEETRSYVKVKAVSLLIALLLGITILVVFCAIIIGRTLLDMLSDQSLITDYRKDLINTGQLLTAEFLLFIVFSIIYYLGPSTHRRFKKILPGALAGSLLFLGSTILYGYYLSHFATYSAFYGSIGAIIGLMTWFYLLGFILILGAAINKSLQDRDYFNV